MSDLSELLKAAVGEVPAFDAASMASKQRQRRRLQAAAAGSTVVAIAVALVMWSNVSHDKVVVSTRLGPRDASTTTVAPSSEPTTTTADGSTTSGTGPGGTTVTTSAPTPRAPQVGDFTGTLTVSATTVHVGEQAYLELRMHNVSGAAINTAQDAMPTKLALYCDRILNPGPPDRVGVFGYYDAWYLASPTVQPYDDAALTAHFEPTADLVGRVSCQAVIVNQIAPARFFPEWRAVTAIPAVTIDVLPAQDATTTT